MTTHVHRLVSLEKLLEMSYELNDLSCVRHYTSNSILCCIIAYIYQAFPCFHNSVIFILSVILYLHLFVLTLLSSGQ